MFHALRTRGTTSPSGDIPMVERKGNMLYMHDDFFMHSGVQYPSGWWSASAEGSYSKRSDWEDLGNKTTQDYNIKYQVKVACGVCMNGGVLLCNCDPSFVPSGQVGLYDMDAEDQVPSTWEHETWLMGGIDPEVGFANPTAPTMNSDRR